MPSAPAAGTIELRVDEIEQLFDTLDPFPFRERDLDARAEEFIVGWARELPRNAPITIVVHYPAAEAKTAAARDLDAALHQFFSYRAGVLQRELNELFRVGRRALAISIPILVGCFVLAHLVGGAVGGTPLRGMIEESFLILGWVANWRPIEIFLYEWWPLARRRDLYKRLSLAQVEARPYSAGA